MVIRAVGSFSSDRRDSASIVVEGVGACCTGLMSDGISTALLATLLSGAMRRAWCGRSKKTFHVMLCLRARGVCVDEKNSSAPRGREFCPLRGFGIGVAALATHEVVERPISVVLSLYRRLPCTGEFSDFGQRIQLFSMECLSTPSPACLSAQ